MRAQLFFHEEVARLWKKESEGTRSDKRGWLLAGVVLTRASRCPVLNSFYLFNIRNYICGTGLHRRVAGTKSNGLLALEHNQVSLHSGVG